MLEPTQSHIFRAATIFAAPPPTLFEEGKGLRAQELTQSHPNDAREYEKL